jgi:mannitol/fructose-specific phosphotransferase system IIA component
MGRSVSSARFQIAKVFNNGTNTETSLGKAISIPHSMLQKKTKKKKTNNNNFI